MTATDPAAATAALLARDQVLATAPLRAAAAASTGDLAAALGQAERLQQAVRQLREAIVRDELGGTGDWWQLAALLAVHPQQAYEDWSHLAADLTPPADQRPGCAVVLTAGLAATHDPRAEYGIDIDDLDASHSLHAEPGVQRLRRAAERLTDDIWIYVTLPGGSEGSEGDPIAGEDAIAQWTSVVITPGELGWLRQMLALNASGDEQPAELDADE